MIPYALPLLLIALSIPLILGIVPPNQLYGFRTPKTMSSPEIWYPANRASGWYLSAAGILSLIFNLVLAYVHPDWPAGAVTRWAALTTFALVILSAVASLLYLRRL